MRGASSFDIYFIKATVTVSSLSSLKLFSAMNSLKLISFMLVLSQRAFPRVVFPEAFGPTMQEICGSIAFLVSSYTSSSSRLASTLLTLPNRSYKSTTGIV